MLEGEKEREKNIPDEGRFETHEKTLAKAASKYNNNNKEKFKH